MSDVFISHVHNDEETAREVACGLEASGYTTWYYEEHAVGGVPYLDQVFEAINGCKVVVLIISAAAMASDQVEAEIIQAFESGKPFVPLLKDISYSDFQSRKSRWKMALRAATAVQIGQSGLAAALSRITRGFERMGIEPAGTAAVAVHTPQEAPPEAGWNQRPAPAARAPGSEGPPPLAPKKEDRKQDAQQAFAAQRFPSSLGRFGRVFLAGVIGAILGAVVASYGYDIWRRHDSGFGYRTEDILDFAIFFGIFGGIFAGVSSMRRRKAGRAALPVFLVAATLGFAIGSALSYIGSLAVVEAVGARNGAMVSAVNGATCSLFIAWAVAPNMWNFVRGVLSLGLASFILGAWLIELRSDDYIYLMALAGLALGLAWPLLRRFVFR